MGNIFFCFDGCAQYLSSPSAPYLIARAYKQSSTPPPVLIACIRNPIDQALSWWQYENNAMTWGESMGLKEWDIVLRTDKYPPKTIVAALEYSQSKFIQQAYRDAEELVKCKLNLNMKSVLTLPPWAITWPGGQLSVIGLGFSKNINRYNQVFKSEFGENTFITEYSAEDLGAKVGHIYIAPIECQKTGSRLRIFLKPILGDVAHRCAARSSQSLTVFTGEMDIALDKVCKNLNSSTRRNSNPTNKSQMSTASSCDCKILHDHFEKEVVHIETMIGKSTGWK